MNGWAVGGNVDEAHVFVPFLCRVLGSAYDHGTVMRKRRDDLCGTMNSGRKPMSVQCKIIPNINVAFVCFNDELVSSVDEQKPDWRLWQSI